MCLYSRLIKNRKYLPNKKNGGKPPPVIDKRTEYVAVGCGRCMECRKQKARNWKARLMEDIKVNKNGRFITVTFSNEAIKELCNEEDLQNTTGYQLDNAIAKKAMRRFLERWRKKYGKSLRHWMVTELGHNGTENIHLHGIIWTTETKDTIAEIWQYGFIWIGQYVNERTINYITKYVTKLDEKHKTYESKVLTSPGIGENFTNTYNATLNEFNGTKTNEAYRLESGHKISLPIYWRNKIYSEKEREQLWLQKLDENVRYIGGEKCKEQRPNNSLTFKR